MDVTGPLHKSVRKSARRSAQESERKSTLRITDHTVRIPPDEIAWWETEVSSHEQASGSHHACRVGGTV